MGLLKLNKIDRDKQMIYYAVKRLKNRGIKNKTIYDSVLIAIHDFIEETMKEVKKHAS